MDIEGIIFARMPVKCVSFGEWMRGSDGYFRNRNSAPKTHREILVLLNRVRRNRIDISSTSLQHTVLQSKSTIDSVSVTKIVTA